MLLRVHDLLCFEMKGTSRSLQGVARKQIRTQKRALWARLNGIRS